jgi:hypothetical protein
VPAVTVSIHQMDATPISHQQGFPAASINNEDHNNQDGIKTKEK